MNSRAINSAEIVAHSSEIVSPRAVRIGGASAFWGDSSVGPIQLARLGTIDFMVFDYLAELTMSILAAQKAKSSDLGYATDFVTSAMRSIAKEVAAGQFRVVSNAGGMNPKACAQALKSMLESMGLTMRIAVVTGDDVLVAMTNQMQSNGDASLNKKLFTANAYLGAQPIQKALDEGAQVVITGRCVDSAVTLGAIAHWFKWDLTNTLSLDRLAQASLAGHIIECGCQATGGLLTDWQTVPDWPTIGYPIVEFAADSSFVVTKPSGTGGCVNVASVGEQIVYEVHDPARYLLPDVSCDFTQVQLTQVTPDQVRVMGSKGMPAPQQLKVSATAMQGYRCNAQLTIVGIDAAAKARRTASAIFERYAGLLQQLNLPEMPRHNFEVLGDAPDSFEVVLFMVATHSDKKALELFAREIAPAGTSFSPGTTGAAGRPAVVPLIEQVSLFIDRQLVTASVELGDQSWVLSNAGALVDSTNTVAFASSEVSARAQPPQTILDSLIEARLIDLAYGRSGDKGDTSNIGILARSPLCLDWLRLHLTEQVVANHLSKWVKGKVTRYEWPGLGGFNFVCEQALDGGGMASLRNDPLGKGMAQRLLAMKLQVPKHLLN